MDVNILSGKDYGDNCPFLGRKTKPIQSQFEKVSKAHRHEVGKIGHTGVLCASAPQCLYASGLMVEKTKPIWQVAKWT